MRSRYLFSGKVVDTLTGQQLHKSKCKSLEEFDEMFTKPVRKKLE